MTNEEIRETRLKVLEKDLASINNRLHHAFNQGFELGRKSTTPKEKTGHWIRQTDDYHDYYECEHCGIAVGLDDIKNYCPNCGFRMFESQESEDKE